MIQLIFLKLSEIGFQMRSKLIIAGLSLIGVFALFGLCLALLNKPKAPQVGPELIVSFKDSGTLEIFGTSIGQRVVEIPSKNKGRLLTIASRSGSSTYALMGTEVIEESINGEVSRCTIKPQQSNSLVMEIRLKDAFGSATEIPSFLTSDRIISQEHRLGQNDPSRDVSCQLAPVDDSPTALGAEMHSHDLPLLIQHRDPLSGWVDLTGPYLFHEGWKDRYVVVLGAWQRDLPTLDFRAVRSDGEAVEFSQPNPDFRKPAGITIPATPLPHVFRGHDYTLSLSPVRRFPLEGNHPFADLGMELRFGGNIMGDSRDGPIELNQETMRVEDEWGNHAALQFERTNRTQGLGAFLPAGSSRMSVFVDVQPTINYPRPESMGYLVLEGTVSHDGSKVDFKLLPDASKFGMKVPPPGTLDAAPSQWLEESKNDWRFLEYKISGENDRSSQELIEARIGEPSSWQHLVIPEGSHSSEGIIPFSDTGNWGKAGDRNHFNRNLNWLGSPAMLRPGARLRFGIFARPPADRLRFEVDLPPSTHSR